MEFKISFIIFLLFFILFKIHCQKDRSNIIPTISSQKSFDEIFQNYLTSIILVCGKSFIKRCQRKKELLMNLHSILQENNIGTGYIESSNLNLIKSSIELIDEGIPSLHLIKFDSNHTIIEHKVLTMKHTYDNLIRFINYNKAPIMIEIASEKELYSSLMNNTVNKAIVFPFIPDIDTVALITKCAIFGDFKYIYQTKNNTFTKGDCISKCVLIYYKNKDGSYIRNAVEIEYNYEVMSKKILIETKKKTDFGKVNIYKMELLFSKNIGSLIFLNGHSNTSKIIDITSVLPKNFIDKYKNQITFSHSVLSNYIIDGLELRKLFQFDKNIKLPGFVYLSPNPLYDDVEKFFVPYSEETKNTFLSTIEKLIINPKESQLSKYKIIFEDNTYPIQKLNNLLQTLKSPSEILLLICPKKSLKYNRIIQRIKRILPHLPESIIFHEIDPFINEFTLFPYQYIPTLAFIKENMEIVKMESDFTTSHIINFIISNSQEGKKVNFEIINKKEVNDKTHPLYPVHKNRFEYQMLSLGKTEKYVGLKRLWKSLKELKYIVKGKNSIKFEDDILKDTDDNFDDADYIKEKEVVPDYKKTEL